MHEGGPNVCQEHQGNRTENAFCQDIPTDGVILETALKHAITDQERINAQGKYGPCGGLYEPLCRFVFHGKTSQYKL
jgi:hypothetical protein